MQDMFESVRRSLVFRPLDGGGGGGDAGTLVDKIGSCIRKSRVFSRPFPPPPTLPPAPRDSGTAAPIRWRKGELIGCGAFGHVYMGMNLDSGELLAVKQVLITTSNASKEKAQAHIRELEEEVKLLKTLSHPNIVRYLGTVREEETLNILLEFVPGGSISSLLGKFESFPEPVIRMYTKQLLLGLEYLHKNGIMHRDIKGANILVDNKGCIKLADFGASKQVVEKATISGAKSMKGTPYWMAPEVILQTGHSFSADIWSVGCTVIEMATGKPPWSQQYQEVAALFYIGTTKSHPPIPEHLSVEAKDFLQKCLQKEPNLRPAASELLQHPFVTGKNMDPMLVSTTLIASGASPEVPQTTIHANAVDVCELGSMSCPYLYPEKLSESGHNWGANSDDDMCQIDDKEMTIACQIDDNKGVVFEETKLKSSALLGDLDQSFNPICEPTEEWGCKFDENLVQEQGRMKMSCHHPVASPSSGASIKVESSSPCDPSLSEDDDEVTESKIKAFLDEKALELKKLQTPLYEEFYNSLNGCCSTSVECTPDEHETNYLKLPPKSRSPKRAPVGTTSAAVDAASTSSPGSGGRNLTNAGDQSSQASPGILSPAADGHPETSSPSVKFSERQRKWKEELDLELERKREMMRLAGIGGKTSSPNNRVSNQRERSRFASPAK